VGRSAFATIDTTFQPIEESSGSTRRIIASGLDVTERRQLERKLAQSQKLEAIGLLAGGIAHDFNNLLGAIANFAGLLVDDLKGRKSEQAYASRIEQACEYGKQVVTQLLAYARPIAESPSKADLRAVLSQMEMLVRPALPPSVLLSVEPGPIAVPVIASKSQLTQIFVNLCLNARDALPDGTGTIDVRLSTLGQSDPDHPASHSDDARGPGIALLRAGTADPTRIYSLVTVADSGTGIDTEKLARIFEPFFSTKRGGKGTGLGLAIVDSTVLSLGGLYTVESKVGAGTCFSVYLPLAESYLATDATTETPTSAQLSRA